MPCRNTLLALALLATAPPLLAQHAPDPTGHWEGSVRAPGMQVPFSIDIARTGGGDLVGTLSLPAEHIKGLPLQKVTVESGSITFYARTDQQLTGSFSDDGGTIDGDYFIEGKSVPFQLARRGSATVDEGPTSPPIDARLQGTWSAVIAAGGADVHVVLTLTNHSDGRSIASIVNLDQGGLRLPLTVVQSGAAVTLTSSVVPSSFSGTLDDHGVLAGTFTQGALSMPVTFRKISDR